MGDISLTPGHINPSLDILGPRQNFIFDYPNTELFLINKFAPIANIPAITRLGFLNNNLTGFGFGYTNDLNAGDSFALQYFSVNAETQNTLLSCTQNSFKFNVAAKGITPIALDDLTTKAYVDGKVQSNFATIPYVDNHTWTTAQITDFNNVVKMFKLSDFKPPVSDISMGGFKITAVGAPINDNDVVNKGFLQSYIASQPIGLIDISAGTKNQLPFARISYYPFSPSVYPAKTPSFLRDDGSWAPVIIPTMPTFPIDINTSTKNQLTINRLAGYPNNITQFLRGDGVWAIPSYPAITVNSVLGYWPLSRLEGFPNNEKKFLRGNGTWDYPPELTYYLNTLPISGDVSLNTYSLRTFGNISAMTGTLVGNNIAPYNSEYLNVLKHIDMRGNRIVNLRDPIDSQDPITKGYYAVDMWNINAITNDLRYRTQYMFGSVASDYPVYFSRSIFVNNENPPWIQQYGSYGWLNNSGNTGRGSDAQVYDIKCTHRIRASEFNAWSSKNIKDIIDVSDNVSAEAAGIISSLPVAKYSYKDQFEGAGEYYGLIAEEVAKVLPYFVSTGEFRFVADIKQVITDFTLIESLLEFELISDVSLEIDMQILMIVANATVQGIVKAINTTRTRLVVEIKDADKLILFRDVDSIFVYGTYKDCPTIAKTRIFEVALCALQFALKSLNALQLETENLREQLVSLRKM